MSWTPSSRAFAWRSHRNGPPSAGLAPAVELDCVVRDRRAEVRTPRGLAVVAVRTRIGQHVHAAVADLYGKSVGMGMRGDAEVSVRAAITTAPDLRGLATCGTQQGHPGIRKLPRPHARAGQRPHGLAPASARDDRAARVRRDVAATSRAGRRARHPGPAATASGWTRERRAAGLGPRRRRPAGAGAVAGRAVQRRCRPSRTAAARRLSSADGRLPRPRLAASRPSSATKHW